ncbi:uncharacterized protein BJ171DRAFT_562845 [Polychytrium aggregatum]|uniref:uncharacterized protein n=1 Tax=Polychytrium aggregatum TaxID=110093 RepID=UPI0022FE69F2|nr:uncharacterized protein BJ171DRAFT_562845 [Polychytrium aggregatum]KAI9197072.1 hypothetical protein BJ171DRAFT_562845 [Polychytrium aggregatum]
MSNYNTVEPTVIDEDLLKRAIHDQVNPEIADIARREGIDPVEVLTLRLDYKNILKIDNLWAYENLVKLQLDNNIIERIENIGFLKHLQWLDLSFNNLTTIEGLDGLTMLTDLTLYNNRISKIENMDDLVNLEVFSIGNNNINVLENISYLTRFEKLRVLNAAGNAICKNPNYNTYVLAHVKNLKYLDYRLVLSEKVATAREKYIDDIIAMEEEEKIALAKKEQARQQNELDTLHEAAHIKGIEILFSSMFDDDLDFQRLFQIDRDRLGEMRDEYPFRMGWDGICCFDLVVNEFKQTVLSKYHEKQDELHQFRTCVDNAKRDASTESIKRLEKYQHNKKQLIRAIQSSRDSKEVEEALKILKDQTSTLSDVLLGYEMTLVEQIEDVIKEIERNYTELCGAINESGQTTFARLREIETEFHEKFSETIVALFERFNKGDMDDLDDDLRDIMGDKDALMNAINGSHDFRLGKFDHQEDYLVTGVAKDMEVVIQRIHEEEIKRNRDRVGEILGFLDKSNSEIEQAEENAY